MSGLRLIKRAPAQNYESDYEISDGLIAKITMDYPDPGLTPIQLALQLGTRKPVKMLSPFGDEVFWSIGVPPKRELPEDIAEYLNGVEGLVEANSYEKHCLWLHYAKDADKYGGFGETRFDWQERTAGYGFTVGTVADKPVHLSLMVNTVNGKRLLFWYATSQMVDHQMIDDWLDNNMPPSARRADGYLNRTDATGFVNILR